MANQEVLKFLIGLQESVGVGATEKQISDACWKILNSGRVIPGYGHAVLRNTDPRYVYLQDFAARKVKGDPLVELSLKCFNVIPGILRELGKVKNPWPNVDAGSGVLLHHYGMREFEYYTVVFSVSRALGCCAQ